MTKAAFDGLEALEALLQAEAQSPDFTSWTTADEIEAAMEALETLKRHFRADGLAV